MGIAASVAGRCNLRLYRTYWISSGDCRATENEQHKE